MNREGSAMLLAGGLGQRMRASGVALPKPLVPVSGCTLLERNVARLLQLGYAEIHLAISAAVPQIRSFAEEKLLPLGPRHGARVLVWEETEPLGNIGPVGALQGRVEQLTVLFADNLTALDLRALDLRHRELGPAMTLATHQHPLRLDYGELGVVGDRVLSYTEKPVHRFTVSSGVYVLGPAALAYAARRGRLGASELVQGLLAQGEHIASFPHAAPWIDINDASAIARAEALIAADPAAFPTPADL